MGWTLTLDADLGPGGDLSQPDKHSGEVRGWSVEGRGELAAQFVFGDVVVGRTMRVPALTPDGLVADQLLMVDVGPVVDAVLDRSRHGVRRSRGGDRRSP